MLLIKKNTYVCVWGDTHISLPLKTERGVVAMTNLISTEVKIRTFSYDKQLQKVSFRILRLNIITDDIIGTFSKDNYVY